MDCDVCVVGLGGIGSAILAQCAARGTRTVGLEQFARGHDLGSSSGRTRMIRQAYFEDPAYVPLVRRAFELWRVLERETGEELLRTTGVLAVGTENSEIIAGIQRAAREHDLPIDSLGREELRRHYPMLRVHSDEVGTLERIAGVLDPERAITAHLAVAARHGAAMYFGVAMDSWRASADGFEVVLDNGSRLTTRTLILALGPWVQHALAEVGILICVQRQMQAWFAPATADYDAANFPAFLLERAGLPAPLYGFPDFGEGLKAAFHGGGNLTSADSVDREIDEARDIEPLVRAMNDWMPGATARFREAKVCMYSLTPDHHFIVDRHPAHDRLILCGGFSGHGFKFAPVIGEIAADLALDGGTRQPIEFLSVRRFRARE